MKAALALAGGLALACAASAQDDSASLFSRLDADGDGYLSSAEMPAEPRESGGYSARRLIGALARDFDGAPVGVVRDILVNAHGSVTGLLVGDSRVPWLRASVGPGASYVTVPDFGASAGGTRPAAPALPRQGEWRATDLLDDVVQLERGVRYANVDDLVIAPWGEVQAVVVDAGPPGTPPGRYAYPWRGDVRSRVHDLRPFDYAARGIAPPR